MKAYLLFVVALAGGLGLWIHQAREQKIIVETQHQAAATRAAIDNIQSTVADLEKKKIIRSTQLVEQSVDVPEIRTQWQRHAFRRFKNEPPLAEAVYKKKTIGVPTEITSEDPAIAAQLASLREQLKTIQQSADLESKLRDARLIFGMTRETVAFLYSTIVIAASLFVILSKKFRAPSEKWAFASVGTILGYWLG